MVDENMEKSSATVKPWTGSDDERRAPTGQPAPKLESLVVVGDDEQEAKAPKFKATKRFLLVFSTLSVMTMMVALDGTSISVALPTIAQQLNGTAMEAFWAGTAFLLSSTVFQPIFASTSHIFGRKPMVMLCLAVFTIGVILAGLSRNFTVLLAGRTIQGVGGGGEFNTRMAQCLPPP